MSDPLAAGYWDARYAEGRTGWERQGLHPMFRAWRDSGVLSPGRILIPGAGRSHEPAALAADGFDVTVVDGSDTAVAHQRKALGGSDARVVQADLLTWRPDRMFDVIYDQTCLCALPPETWESYAARLHGWLRPGGALAVLFMQSTRPGGPPFHCDLDQMRALFAAPAWAWPETLPEPVPHTPPELFEQPAVLRRG